MSRLFALHCLHRFVWVKHTSSTNLECWFAQNATAATEKSPCLELAHNILCKQNLAASDSPLVSINLHENNNFTSNATWCNVIMVLENIFYEMRTLQNGGPTLKATFTVLALSLKFLRCRQHFCRKPFKSCRHFVFSLRCTADEPNTASRRQKLEPSLTRTSR